MLFSFFVCVVRFNATTVGLQMYALWEVPVNGGNGKERYGDDYADIYAINRLHFKAAMNDDCDHVSRTVSGRACTALVSFGG